MKQITLALAVVLVALPLSAGAESKKDPVKITCEEFAASTPEAQSRVAAYLDGSLVSELRAGARQLPRGRGGLPAEEACVLALLARRAAHLHRAVA